MEKSKLTSLAEELERLMEDESLFEDELVDDFTEVDNDDTVLEPVQSVSNVSLTDELDAKARIARGLDFLKASIESFKSAIVTELNLLQDGGITSALEGLDLAVETLTSSLGGKIEDSIDNQIGLDLTTEEEPVEEEPVEEEADEDIEVELDDDEEVEEKEETGEEEPEESDFEEEAEFDLFK